MSTESSRPAQEFSALRTSQALALSAGIFLSLFSHRSDYAGHFLAGAGGAMLLLGFIMALPGAAIGYEAVAAVLIAIALGWVTESTIFKLAVFDAVDFANQSLGAALAGAGVVGRSRSLRDALVCLFIGSVLLVAGFWFAFS